MRSKPEAAVLAWLDAQPPESIWLTSITVFESRLGLALLPQGRVEQDQRALDMVAQMDAEGFGACTTTGACSAACPKEISLINIAKMNREFLRASITKKEIVHAGDMA